MKALKVTKGSTEAELGKMIVDKVEALRKFRFNIAGSKIKNVREGRSLRRDIGRIKTQLNNGK